MRLNASLLNEKISILRRDKACSAELQAALESLIHSPDEFAPYRVNPCRFAAERGFEESATVDLFLSAAKAGLFLMHWDLLCTGCGDLVDRFDSLRYMHGQYHCGICQTDYEADLEDSIEVSFTLSPAVRDLLPMHPEKLSAEEYYFRWLLNPSGQVHSGESYVDYIRPMVCLVSYVEAGEQIEKIVDLKPGILTGFDGLTKTGFGVKVDGEPGGIEQVLTFTLNDTGTYHASASSVRPGRLRIRLSNPGPTRASAFLFCVAEGLPQHPTRYASYLSAKKLFNHHAFRDAFSGEILGDGESLKAKDLCFLFTDLTGSTALYERLGDVKAYALVRQHFGILSDIIGCRQGAVVKTMGDAVMATFESPAASAAAALAMLEDVRSFNQSHGRQDLLLKIGLHRGPCIAVSSNGRLDFFGQTVNIAARVQAMAGSEEICATEGVWAAEDVAAIFGNFRHATEITTIKGLDQPLKIWRLSQPNFGDMTPYT